MPVRREIPRVLPRIYRDASIKIPFRLAVRHGCVGDVRARDPLIYFFLLVEPHNATVYFRPSAHDAVHAAGCPPEPASAVARTHV